MNIDLLRAQVEQTVRRSEIRAVARAIQNGQRPKAGDVLNYTIEGDSHGVFNGVNGAVRKKRIPSYQLTIEDWHLAAAIRMIQNREL